MYFSDEWVKLQYCRWNRLELYQQRWISVWWKLPSLWQDTGRITPQEHFRLMNCLTLWVWLAVTRSVFFPSVFFLPFSLSYCTFYIRFISRVLYTVTVSSGRHIKRKCATLLLSLIRCLSVHVWNYMFNDRRKEGRNRSTLKRQTDDVCDPLVLERQTGDFCDPLVLEGQTDDLCDPLVLVYSPCVQQALCIMPDRAPCCFWTICSSQTAIVMWIRWHPHSYWLLTQSHM